MSIQTVVLLVPVFLGFAGFAVDLGRLYSARNELRTAAEAMALAAAGKLIGTDVSTDDATTTARLAINTSSGFGDKYEYGGLVIGQTNGTLNSEVPDPSYYDTAAAAIGDDASGTGTQVSGSLARHVRVTISAEAPLVFWNFLSLAQDRKTSLQTMAVAGVSAPLCTACGIESFAIAPLDATDSADFGFTQGSKYTLGFMCTGTPPPQPLPNTVARIQYLILNRLNPNATAFSADDQQLYRTGAQGLVPNSDSTLACFSVNAAEQIWASAAPLACTANQPAVAVTEYLCGLATRFDTTLVQGCGNITDIDTLSTLYQPDADQNDLDDYLAYVGNQRRLMTVPIVDQLSATSTMTVLGFRQFLLEPTPNSSNLAANDSNGRFVAMYLGTVAPVKQGRFDGSCGLTSGPGKVVLHR